MGDYAEMTLDGTLCQVCGVYMGPHQGYPRSCRNCQEDAPKKKKKQPGAAEIAKRAEQSRRDKARTQERPA